MVQANCRRDNSTVSLVMARPSPVSWLASKRRSGRFVTPAQRVFSRSAGDYRNGEGDAAGAANRPPASGAVTARSRLHPLVGHGGGILHQLEPHGVEEAEGAGEAQAEDPGEIPHAPPPRFNRGVRCARHAGPPPGRAARGSPSRYRTV